MTGAGFAAFFLQLLPALRELARLLFEQHGGDVEKARATIKRIKDHGAQLREFDAEIMRKMDELQRQREQGGQS